MSEKRFEMVITDEKGNFHYLDNVTGEKITSTLTLENKLNELAEENRELRQELQKKQEEEQLYANEIVKLNKEAKEVLNFKKLSGEY